MRTLPPEVAKFSVEELRQLILDERQLQIFFFYYGLAGHTQHTLKEISKALNIHQHRPREVIDKVLETIKRHSPTGK